MINSFVATNVPTILKKINLFYSLLEANKVQNQKYVYVLMDVLHLLKVTKKYANLDIPNHLDDILEYPKNIKFAIVIVNRFVFTIFFFLLFSPNLWNT